MTAVEWTDAQVDAATEAIARARAQIAPSHVPSRELVQAALDAAAKAGS